MTNEIYDMIDAIFNRMDKSEIEHIVKQMLRSEVRATAKQAISRGHFKEVALQNIAEKLQRKLSAKAAQDFSQELFEECGIDARSVQTSRGSMPVDSIADLMAFCDSIEYRSRGKH